MPERRRDDPGGRQPSWAGGLAVVGVEAGEVGEVVRAALHPDRFAFEPADRGAHRRLAGLDHRALHPWVVGHGVEHARRLRCLERQVEAGHPARVRAHRVAVRGQPAGAGTEPGEHGSQIVGVDLAVEAERLGAAADPLAVRLAGTGVVVVERLGDTGQVVGLLADAELGD